VSTDFPQHPHPSFRGLRNVRRTLAQEGSRVLDQLDKLPRSVYALLNELLRLPLIHARPVPVRVANFLFPQSGHGELEEADGILRLLLRRVTYRSVELDTCSSSELISPASSSRK